MNLTEHFTLEEMTRSDTAKLHQIDNTPNGEQVANLKNLCEKVLEPLRAHINAVPKRGRFSGADKSEDWDAPENRPLLGDPSDPPGPVPLIPSSGFRCPELNQLVGGSPKSQHQTGEAADLIIESPQQGRDWVLWIEENVNFDQVFLEKNSKNHYWVHVSCRRDLSKNRHQVLKLQVKGNF